MTTRRLLPAPLIVLALASVAQAQTPTPPVVPPPPPPPAPAAGKASLAVKGGLATRKANYFAPSQQVVVRGVVKPYVKGEVLTLYAIRGKKASKKVRRAVGRGGRYEFRFKVGNPGPVRLVVKHRASDGQVAFRTRSETIQVVSWRAGAGSSGVKVLLLQRGLLKLGFATPVTGYYDGLTANAVNTFRKTNDLGRDGYATKTVYAMVMRHDGASKLRYPSSGTRRVAPRAGAGRPRAPLPRVPRLVGQALDADGVRQLPLLPPGAGDELPRDGLLLVLHRRIRDPRLRIRAELPGKPRLPASADPERHLDLQLDRLGRSDLHVPVARSLRALAPGAGERQH